MECDSPSLFEGQIIYEIDYPYCGKWCFLGKDGFWAEGLLSTHAEKMHLTFFGILDTKNCFDEQMLH